VACLFRLLLATAVALAVAAPSYAANGDAPGVLKKQGPTADAPAADAAPTADVPQPTDAVTTPTLDTKAKGNVPVTKGTIKKLTTTQPATTDTTGSLTTTTTTTRTRTHSVQRSRSRTTSSTRTANSTRPHSTARKPTRRTPVAVTPAAAKPATDVPSAATPFPLDTPRTAHRTAVKHAAPVWLTKKPVTTKDSAPLSSITRAADRVVEVIPGAVLLALAGLTGLVLLLMVRSWAMERRRAGALEKSYGVTVEALATAIEAKDHTTGGHIERVRKLGLLLAGEIAPRDARDPQMAYGFLLHDIGKLAVPDAILRAPGRLGENEWALMRRHPEEGVRMLASVPFLDKALDVVRYHHERWDGGGYPEGLSGTDIPLWARIFSVVDALDAMTAERPYQSARPYQAALEEIRRHAGGQFDPDVVDALERLDAAAVEPLLEPTQILEPELMPELADLVPIGPLVAA
jgi:HD-GYP domain-containing protein (c-di-GMP phosphodiesterase class II)